MRSCPRLSRILALALALVVPAAAGNEGEKAPAPLRVVVFLVDAAGKPRLADALTCPAEVRVNHHTGTPHELDFLRYSFTPHPATPQHHWTVSF